MNSRIHIFLHFVLILSLSFSLQGQNSSELTVEDSKAAKKIVKLWSDAHEEWNYEQLQAIYSDSLLFYTQYLPVSEVLSKITSMFRPREVFRHKIISDIDLKVLPSGNVKCNFTKEVTTKGKKKSYPSYLVLSKLGDQYFIIVESDYVTDANLHYTYDENTTGIRAASLRGTSQDFGPWIYLLVAIFLFSATTLIFMKRKKTPQIQTTSVSNNSESKNDIEELVVVESNDDTNKKKGDEFEKYIIGKFDPAYFKSIAWRSDKAAHGHFPESNSYPDLEFEFKHNFYKAEFAVECKYRSSFNRGYIDLGDFYKLNKYRKYEREQNKQVYIVIGVGGQPSCPDELFLIPLPHLEGTKIHKNKLYNEFSKSINSNFFYNMNLNLLT